MAWRNASKQIGICRFESRPLDAQSIGRSLAGHVRTIRNRTCRGAGLRQLVACNVRWRGDTSAASRDSLPGSRKPVTVAAFLRPDEDLRYVPCAALEKRLKMKTVALASLLA